MPYNEINEEFIDQGWQQMKALLDRDLPVKPVLPIWKRWTVLLFLFLILGLLALDSRWDQFLIPTDPIASVETSNATASEEVTSEGEVSIDDLPPEAARQESTPSPSLHKKTSNNSLLKESRTQPIKQETNLTQAIPSDRPVQSRNSLVETSFLAPVEQELEDGKTLTESSPIEERSSISLSSLKSNGLLLLDHEFQTGPDSFWIPSISKSRWSMGLAAGLGISIDQLKPVYWAGLEGSYQWHRRWSVWGRLQYQWNRFGPQNRNEDATFARADNEEVDPEQSGQEYRAFSYRQQPEELAVHRIGALAGIAYRPHRAIRLEAGFQMNYFLPYTYQENPPPVVPSGSTISYEKEELQFKSWEPIAHLGFYWRLSPVFQLGASWQQGLGQISETESYSLRSQQLSIGLRWRLIP